MQLIEIKNKALEEIRDCQDLKTLKSIKIKYLGRKGQLTAILRSLKDLDEKERKEKGRLANLIKREIEEAIRAKSKKFQVLGYKLREGWLDVTVPGLKHPQGHLHPRTIVLRQIEEIFQSMGFSVVEGPEIETDWYNFEALNIPKDHPARDMQDTLYINEELVLRTHTSPMQVRYMEKHQPPLKIIVPGKVFRREATDASHDYQFYQVEGLMVEKNVSIANFKAIIEEFFNRLYKQKVKIRLRPSYFPFTEPSFEVDMSCFVCHGQGCSVCAHTGWLEMAGAGMVHPFVFKSSGYNPNDWQGFAFGLGLERIVMMKYKIDDIRLFSSGDLRFLRQF